MIGKDEQTIPRTDSLSGDEANVAKLLYSLPRAEATKDFDFKLKARIAQRRAVPSRPGYMKALAFAAPLFIALIIISVFLFRQPGRSEEISEVGPAVQPKVETPEVPASDLPAAPTSSRPELPMMPTAERGPVVTASKRPADRTNADIRPGSRRAGSFDTAVSPSDTLLPRGFNANSVVRSMTNPGSPVPNPGMGEILKLYGVNATRGAGGWTVSSVSGIAASSGVQKGDVIESRQTDANGTRLYIKRGSSKIQISLKP